MSTIAKASQQLLLDEINRSNNLEANPLTLNEMAMGFPVGAMNNNVFYNTTVILYGIPQGGYHGKVSIRYQRYNLLLLFRYITPVLIADPSPTKISDLLPLLNDQFGLALAESDIEDAPIPAGTEDGLVMIKATANNWAWLGQIQVRFLKTLPYLADVVTTLDLGELGTVVPFTTKPRAEYLTYGYDWGDLSTFLNGIGIGTVITPDTVVAINNFVNIKLVIKEPADVLPDEVNVKNCTWTFRGSTLTDQKYNSEDFNYVLVLNMSVDSNYEGQMFFHF